MQSTIFASRAVTSEVRVMNFQHVGEALRYFENYWPLLGVDVLDDVDEGMLLASNEGRLRFVDAILNTLIEGQLDVPEAVILGGLSAIVDTTATILPYSIFAEDVPTWLRADVLSKMHTVFAEIFARRCDQTLASRATAPQSPWNQLCFMWWELLPRHGVPSEVFLEETDIAIVRLIGASLKVDHIACKESALHGLALWYAARPDDVRREIDKNAYFIPPALSDYALAARVGNLQ
ncbi:hypothetical protein HXP36_00285 [Ralstonia solanacearum]|nr:hypothetical protein [Ralstonia solanacearum]